MKRQAVWPLPCVVLRAVLEPARPNAVKLRVVCDQAVNDVLVPIGALVPAAEAFIAAARERSSRRRSAGVRSSTMIRSPSEGVGARTTRSREAVSSIPEALMMTTFFADAFTTRYGPVAQDASLVRSGSSFV